MNTASASCDISDTEVPDAVVSCCDPAQPSVRSRVAPGIAFFIAVFASMAAAATVVSEAPLMLVGLY